MNAPSLCIIHEGIGNETGIAKVALDNVFCALRAGWNVSVIAKTLDRSLRSDVEWLRLYVPPRGHLLKWITAGNFIRAALGRRRFDVIHAHQPQAANLSDVFTCHFLTRAAHARDILPPWHPLRSGLARLQQLGALPAEDRCFRRWNPSTRLLFCSALLRDEFLRFYPRPPRIDVLENACPAREILTDAQRRAARTRLVGREWKGPVLGYLGGLDERKGYRLLLQAMETERTTYLLLGGPSTETLPADGLPPRCKSLGWIDDMAEFFAACDAVIVPSAFDPCPLAVLEAVAHGVPVIATRGVGNLPSLLRYGAGVEWTPGIPLGPIVQALAARRATYQAGTRLMATELGKARNSARLIDIYETIRCEKQGTPAKN